MSKKMAEYGDGPKFRRLRIGISGLFCFRTERGSIMPFLIEVSSYESKVL